MKTSLNFLLYKKYQLYISFKNTYDKTIIYKKGDLKIDQFKLPEDFETYPEARKNAFLKMKELKESGRRIVGVFCTYTPWELIEAADAAAVVLCGIGDDNIPIAETRLPQNLCPLIKASYGAASLTAVHLLFFGHGTRRDNLRWKKENV